MDAVEPSLFYTGLVAELYAPLRSSEPPDPAPYARFVARSGEPALELGCGDGEPLLDLRASGLDVEGLDSSPDMLARCRAAAAERGLAVTLHESRIEEMELVRRYRSIYLAGATFNLIVDDDTAWRALTRIRAHLEPDGSALIPLFIPRPLPVEVFGVARTHITDDGRDDARHGRVGGAGRGSPAPDRGPPLRARGRGRAAHGGAPVGAPLAHPGRLPPAARRRGAPGRGRAGPDGRPAEADADQFTFWIGPDPAYDIRSSVRDRLPPAGRALAAGMLGLDQAIYGERPKVEIVAEADADGLDLGDVDLDLEDPAQSRMTVADDD